MWLVPLPLPEAWQSPPQQLLLEARLGPQQRPSPNQLPMEQVEPTTSRELVHPYPALVHWQLLPPDGQQPRDLLPQCPDEVTPVRPVTPLEQLSIAPVSEAPEESPVVTPPQGLSTTDLCIAHPELAQVVVVARPMLPVWLLLPLVAPIFCCCKHLVRSRRTDARQLWTGSQCHCYSSRDRRRSTSTHWYCCQTGSSSCVTASFHSSSGDRRLSSRGQPSSRCYCSPAQWSRARCRCATTTGGL